MQGLSYFLPAMPVRPTDRGGRNFSLIILNTYLPAVQFCWSETTIYLPYDLTVQHALTDRLVDGSVDVVDTAYTHFIPNAYDQNVLSLIKNASATAGAVQQVWCSNHLVHGKPIVSKTGKGVAIPLVNWAGTGIESLPNLTVTVNISAVKPGMKATLATGGKVTELPLSGNGGVSFLLDLGIADALILR